MGGFWGFFGWDGEVEATWGQDADGHEQHVLLLVKVQLLQAHLEFHQWLQQVHAVAGWGERSRQHPALGPQPGPPWGWGTSWGARLLLLQLSKGSRGVDGDF